MFEHNFYFSPNVVTVIKISRVVLAGRGCFINKYLIFLQVNERKRPFRDL